MKTYKSESQLQAECIVYFHNTFKKHRKTLIEINNSTTNGASRKALGLVKGASDLVLCTKEGLFCPLEIKLNGTRHDIKHVREQLHFIENIKSRSGLGFFVWNFNQFKNICEFLLMENLEAAKQYSTENLKKVEKMLEKAETKKTKTFIFCLPV